MTWELIKSINIQILYKSEELSIKNSLKYLFVIKDITRECKTMSTLHVRMVSKVIQAIYNKMLSDR